jgi:hypothetical protein
LKYCAIEYILYESAAAVKVPTSFWTSGANEGEYCDVEQTYSWCAEGTQVKRKEMTLPFVDANPPDAKERCLSLNLKESNFSLDYVECTATKYTICEVKATSGFATSISVIMRICYKILYFSHCATALPVLLPALQTYAHKLII